MQANAGLTQFICFSLLWSGAFSSVAASNILIASKLAEKPNAHVLSPSNPRTLEGSVSDIDFETIEDEALTPSAKFFEPFIRINDKTLDLEALVASDKDLGLSTHGTHLTELPSSNYQKKVVSLPSGKMIFAPFVDTTVETPFGNVEIDAKSIALIITSSKGTAVFNFDDLHRDAVRIRAGKTTLNVAPGRHLMVTSAAVSGFDQVNPNEAIGYRGLSEANIGSGLKVFRAEFSVPSAVGSFKALKTLLISRHPSAQKLSKHMTKTAAAILQMNRGAERYQQILNPHMSAYDNSNER